MEPNTGLRHADSSLLHSGSPQGELPDGVSHFSFGCTAQRVCELPRAGTECPAPPSAQCLAYTRVPKKIQCLCYSKANLKVHLEQ